MKDVKIFTKNIEQSAVEQIDLLANQDVFKDCKIRIMPDVHSGIGCVIGFTADLGEKVIPNIVGVDIGCGMLTSHIGNIDIDFRSLDSFIKNSIPNGRYVYDFKNYSFNRIKDLKCYNEIKNIQQVEYSIGTLGGGNHFIEIGNGVDGKHLIIHTGSRNLGTQVAKLYQNKAIDFHSNKKELELERKTIISKYKSEGRERELSLKLKELNERQIELKIPNDLCYLTGIERDNYLHDMKICQEFAILNRQVISRRIMNFLGIYEYDSFDTMHNYIDMDSNIVRKGAISAKLGEKVLIPINMRDGCIVAYGKGNSDWNFSAPHGAGRIMSRTKAKETLQMDEFSKSMSGIYTTSVSYFTIDEAPMVYKDIDEIIENTKETISIIEVLKPLYNFKANS